MGYKKKMSIERITNLAEKFGLGRKTGIEIDEVVLFVLSKKRKIDALKTNVIIYIVNDNPDNLTECRKFFPLGRGVPYEIGRAHV